MQIDWFTLIAQIVNFLILVWLLKRFLYGPIVKAMEKREATIASRLQEADHKQEQADQEAASYRAKQDKLEQQRKELMQKAEADAEAHRRELMQNARQEVEAVQTEWHDAVRRERTAFLQSLRERIGAQVVATTRRALDDLADAELGAQVVRVFTERLRGLDEDARGRLAAAVASAREEGVVVRSAFELTSEQREQITTALCEQLDEEIDPHFATDPRLGLGIELRVAGWTLAWSVESYLEAVADEIASALDRESADVAKSPSTEQPPPHEEAGAPAVPREQPAAEA